MKILRAIASLTFLALVILACVLPKYFYWQVPLGLAGFYLALCLLLFSELKLINLLSVIIWLVTSYAPASEVIQVNSGKISIRSGNQSVYLDSETLQIENLPEGQPLINDLQQKTGKVSLVKLKDQEGKDLSIATIELGNLYSFAGWEQNKILIRRLAAILRQENGQIIVLMRGKGPFFHSVAKGFAYQIRAEKVFTTSLSAQLLGFGSDLVFMRN